MVGRLAAALIATVVASAPRVARADDIAEATVYAANKRPLGSDAQRRNVAGVGVAWVDAPPPTRTGWTLRFGAAIEHEAECEAVRATCPFPGGDTDHVEGGAHVRVGWLWRYVQLEGGVLAFSRTITTGNVTQVTQVTQKESTFLPEVVARLGPRTLFLAVGHGTYVAPTLLAPLLYVQAEIGFAERWATTLTAGTVLLSELRHERFDLGMRYQLTRNLRTGEGLALASARRLGGEARIEVAWSF